MMAKRVQLLDIFQRSLRNDPDGSRKDQFKAFLKEVRENDALIVQLAEDYFDRFYHRFKNDEKDGSNQVVGTSVEERRAAAIAARQEREAQIETMAQARVNRVMEQVKRVIMLDLIMPNGKKLRYCTFAEVTKFGGLFADIGKCGKPTQVIDKHLNEADLQNLRARHLEGKRRGGQAGVELHA